MSATEPFDTSTPMGRAMVGMLGVWAQLEADMISERTRGALAAYKARGGRMGPAPVVEARPELLELVGKLFAAGKSQNQIVAELNSMGVPALGGDKWHRSSVRRVLRTLTKGAADSEGDAGDGSGDALADATPTSGQVAAGLEDREDL